VCLCVVGSRVTSTRLHRSCVRLPVACLHDKQPHTGVGKGGRGSWRCRIKRETALMVVCCKLHCCVWEKGVWVVGSKMTLTRHNPNPPKLVMCQ